MVVAGNSVDGIILDILVQTQVIVLLHWFVSIVPLILLWQPLAWMAVKIFTGCLTWLVSSKLIDQVLSGIPFLAVRYYLSC